MKIVNGFMNMVMYTIINSENKMKHTTIQLKKKLVRGGMNTRDADELAKNHINYLNRVYPDATLKQKAEIAMTLGK